jgi:hypothetical protein
MKNDANFNRYLALVAAVDAFNVLLFVAKVAAIGYVIHLIIH